MSEELKLKTLKDIEKEFTELGEDGTFLNALYRCRQAAKQWIQRIDKQIVDEVEGDRSDHKLSGFCGAKEMLRTFFNLPEEP